MTAQTLTGPLSDQLKLRSAGRQDWLITPIRPLDGDVHVRLEAAGGDTVRLGYSAFSANSISKARHSPKRCGGTYGGGLLTPG